MRGEVEADRDADENEPEEEEGDEDKDEEGEEDVAGGGIGGGGWSEGSEEENNEEEEENVEVSGLKDMFMLLLAWALPRDETQTQAHRKYARGVLQSKDQGGGHTVKMVSERGWGVGEW